MESTSIRRVLVIGGASLLGSHLCERLVEDGHEVIAIDDFTTGSFATLSHLKHEPRFAFVEHDVTAKFDAHVDAVFHLAVPSSRRACESDPIRATVTGVMGTVHALEVASAHDARIVVATSFERWGPGVRCAESLVRDFSRTRTVDARIVRVASAYGPRMPLDDPHVVTRLSIQALRGEPLVLSPAPGARETLSYVAEAVETLVRAMEAPHQASALVAPYVETTVEAVARAVLDVASHGEALPGIEPTVRWIEQRLLGVRDEGRRGRTSGIFGPPPLTAALKTAG